MPLRTAFWQRAAQSLPPSVRKRYAADLEFAERVDLFIAGLVDAWRQARSALFRRRRKAYTGLVAKRQVLSVALQGGGSHGAFTWGVLDRLLEDERIEIDGISGASAGAMNAAVAAYGLTTGGREGARRALADFWTSVAAKVPSPLAESLVFLARFLSPSQFNPLNLNPLRDILAAQVDFARLRAESAARLFIAATNVRTGMPRVFRTPEITADVVLASACLPWMHRTVEIDGEAYWDGGLSANPPVRPLLYECEARDIVLVLLQPARRPALPHTAEAIWSRLTEGRCS
jgi:NTE family protein